MHILCIADELAFIIIQFLSKTTLLSCLVGLKQLDHGIMKVFGNRPGQKNSRLVGYMPQVSEIDQIKPIPALFNCIECKNRKFMRDT